MLKIHKEDEKHLMLNLDIKEATFENVQEFKAELIKLFDACPKTIILNLAKLEYVDSAFLGAFVSALKYIMPLKKDVILVGLRADIANLFTMIRLDKIFKIYSNFNEAIANS